MDMHEEYSRTPRKLMSVRPSKYEAGTAVRENRKYWKSVLNEVDTTYTSPSLVTESRLIGQVLPSYLYEKVCDTLNIPQLNYFEEKQKRSSVKPRRRVQKAPMLSFKTALTIDREAESDTEVEFSESEEEQPNCHWDLMKKPVRQQITWKSNYLQPEKEDEKSLITKSDDVTDRIATEFCRYMTELGGNQQSQLFTPQAIKELFQIEFNTHVARGLQVVSEEIPAVLDKIANAAGCPEKSKLAVLEREVSKDIAAEAQENVTRAFGTSLPIKEKRLGPRNNTKTFWRSARHVPNDLVTMKTIWEGITNLRSVREYCGWMIDHPEHRRAPYLRSLGMFDPAVLHARTTFELKTKDFMCSIGDEAPAPIDHIRKRLSSLADSEQ